MSIINQVNNIEHIEKLALKGIEDGKRKLQESIVALNRSSKNSHNVNLIRKSIQLISFVQTQLEK